MLDTNLMIQFWALMILSNVVPGGWGLIHLAGATVTFIVAFWTRKPEA